MRIPLAGQTYTARSLAAAAQTCTNVFPEKIEDPNEREKGSAFMVGCPGRHLAKLLTTIDAAATPLRGLFSGGGRLFVAAGTKYFELDSTYSLVGSVRTISDDASHYPVQFFVNGNQLMIVDAKASGAGVVYVDNGSGPTVITLPAFTGISSSFGIYLIRSSGDPFDPGMVGQAFTFNAVAYTVATYMGPDNLTLTGSAGVQSDKAFSCTPTMGAVTGAFLDGYFMVNLPTSRTIRFSPIDDGTNAGTYIWSALDSFVKEGYPDYVQSILTEGEQLYAFGTDTFQVYQDTGNATTPFQPILGSMQKLGSVSSWGPIAIDGRVFLVGGTSGGVSAYVLNGFKPQRISTHAIEAQWNKAGVGKDCVSYAYEEEGHSFWLINFGSQLWAYDTTTGAWHERKIYTAGAFAANTTLYHAYVEWPSGAKQHITGGGDANLYVQSINYYDDNGTDMKWERALPYQYNEGKRMYFGRMTLDMETGAVASGAAPVVSRDYSDDRGRTFSATEDVGIGTHNQSGLLVDWPTGGSCDATGRIWRLSGVGQSKVALVALDCDITLGSV